MTDQIFRRSDAESDTSTSRLANCAVKIHLRREIKSHVLMVGCECLNANGREPKYSSGVNGVRNDRLTRVKKVLQCNSRFVEFEAESLGEDRSIAAHVVQATATALHGTLER